MEAASPNSPSSPAVALALGRRTYPRLGMRRGVERFVREREPAWTLISKTGHTHLEWSEVMDSAPDGLLGFFEDPGQFEWVHSQPGLIAVNMHRVPGCGGIPEVLVDDPEVGSQAARHLMEKGFRKFGFCTHLPEKGFSIDRMEGFRMELEKAGAKMDLLAMKPGNSEAIPDLRKWVEKAGEDRPAVFCCDDACAALLIASCRQTGLQVPDDLAILGAGNDDFHIENDSITLSSVKVDFAGVGYHAAALLTALLEGKPQPRETLKIPSQGIAERSSTASGSEPPALRRLFRMLDERHTDPDFNPDVAADLCHVSARTLRRYLKESGRPSLADLLRSKRLETAMQQLLVTKDPVERVAEYSGFIDYTTFFRAFRKRYGMSPTDKRRNATERSSS